MFDIKNKDGKVIMAALVEYTGLSRSTFSKTPIRKLLAEHESASDNASAIAHKRKKAGRDDILAEKDRQIAELRVKNSK